MKPSCKTAYIAECKIAVATVRPLTMRTVKLFTEKSIRFQRVSAYSMICEFALFYVTDFAHILIMIPRSFYIKFLFSFETSIMVGITDITFIHSTIKSSNIARDK